MLRCMSFFSDLHQVFAIGHPIDFEDLPIVYLKNADVPSLCQKRIVTPNIFSVEDLNLCGFNGLFCRAA